MSITWIKEKEISASVHLTVAVGLLSVLGGTRNVLNVISLQDWAAGYLGEEGVAFYGAVADVLGPVVTACMAWAAICLVRWGFAALRVREREKVRRVADALREREGERREEEPMLPEPVLHELHARAALERAALALAVLIVVGGGAFLLCEEAAANGQAQGAVLLVFRGAVGVLLAACAACAAWTACRLAGWTAAAWRLRKWEEERRRLGGGRGLF